jgi:hypothetical protein
VSSKYERRGAVRKSSSVSWLLDITEDAIIISRNALWRGISPSFKFASDSTVLRNEDIIASSGIVNSEGERFCALTGDKTCHLQRIEKERNQTKTIVEISYLTLIKI